MPFAEPAISRGMPDIGGANAEARRQGNPYITCLVVKKIVKKPVKRGVKRDVKRTVKKSVKKSVGKRGKAWESVGKRGR